MEVKSQELGDMVLERLAALDTGRVRPFRVGLSAVRQPGAFPGRIEEPEERGMSAGTER